METTRRKSIGLKLMLIGLIAGQGGALGPRALGAGGSAAGAVGPGALSPDDAKQQARFDAAARAVAKAGYTNPSVVGLSQEPTGALFALEATHRDQGVLVAVIEPSGSQAAHPIEIETERRPVDLAVHGVRFEPFLDTTDLVDVIVDHQPFQLEMSSTFERHHVLRRKGGELTLTCDFAGGATSSVAKGPRSVTSTRTVTVEKVAGVPAGSAFDVKTVDETIESTHTGRGAATTAPTERSESKLRYELNASGMYQPTKK